MSYITRNRPLEKMKKIFLKTFGCQMNVRDSEVISGLLKANHWQLVSNIKEADVIIFNTCSVRKHAEEKVWSEIGRLKVQGSRFKDNQPIIGIVGCMAQYYKEKIFERAPEVDFVVGPNDLHKIPGIINDLLKSKIKNQKSKIFEKKFWETESEFRPEEIYHTGFYQDKGHAYVIISEGCSNYCSYCVVPYTRGPLRNRNFKDILTEIKQAIDSGITKFTLIGQNVNAYKYEDFDFLKLIESVDNLQGIKEFSFITCHPKDTNIKLFEVMANCQNLKKYLHLPVQSGSDRILNLMKREYTKAYYLDLVDSYRKIVNGLLSTDIIVGFPTETEEDFQQTLDLVKRIEFDFAYIFKYSLRPYTEASRLTDDVPLAEKQKRHRILLNLQKTISCRKKKSDCLC